MPANRPRKPLRPHIALSLERDFVVEVGAEVFAGAGGLVALAAAEAAAAAATAAGVAAAVVVAAGRGAAAVAAAEHGQFTAELLQDDLGRVLLDALGVGPFAGLQGALDVNAGALLKV